MIGVLGGTFDPVHFGHLRPALEMQQALGLAEVRFVPLNVAVHRRQPEASGAQRLAMVRAAVGGEPQFRVDARELQRTGRSYSYETLRSLRSELGDRQPICLLTGSDAFRDFLSWHRPDDILELAHLVVMQRPGADAGLDARLRDWMAPRLLPGPEGLDQRPGGHILLNRVTQLDISSTAIRRIIRAGRSPRYLLPDAVLEIIEREDLYRGRIPD